MYTYGCERRPSSPWRRPCVRLARTCVGPLGLGSGRGWMGRRAHDSALFTCFGREDSCADRPQLSRALRQAAKDWHGEHPRPANTQRSSRRSFEAALLDPTFVFRGFTPRTDPRHGGPGHGRQAACRQALLTARFKRDLHPFPAMPRSVELRREERATPCYATHSNYGTVCPNSTYRYSNYSIPHAAP